MDEQTLLDFGMRIHEAERDWRLDSLIKEISKLPAGADRDMLLAAAAVKESGRFVRYPNEVRLQVYDLAKLWCRMNKAKRRKYETFLEGLITLDNLDDDRQAKPFHEALVRFSGSSDPKAIIKALFRVREATAQLLARSDTMKDWSPDWSITTIWPVEPHS